MSPAAGSGIGDGAVTLPIQLPRELSNALQAGPANSLFKLAGIRYLMNPTVFVSSLIRVDLFCFDCVCLMKALVSHCFLNQHFVSHFMQIGGWRRQGGDSGRQPWGAGEEGCLSISAANQ
jgi:hypothetical protein